MEIFQRKKSEYRTTPHYSLNNEHIPVTIHRLTAKFFFFAHCPSNHQAHQSIRQVITLQPT